MGAPGMPPSAMSSAGAVAGRALWAWTGRGASLMDSRVGCWSVTDAARSAAGEGGTSSTVMSVGAGAKRSSGSLGETAGRAPLVAEPEEVAGRSSWREARSRGAGSGLLTFSAGSSGTAPGGSVSTPGADGPWPDEAVDAALDGRGSAATLRPDGRRSKPRTPPTESGVERSGAPRDATGRPPRALMAAASASFMACASRACISIAAIWRLMPSMWRSTIASAGFSAFSPASLEGVSVISRSSPSRRKRTAAAAAACLECPPAASASAAASPFCRSIMPPASTRRVATITGAASSALPSFPAFSSPSS
mmetsp:Transcript_5706/g.14438  ORF Transcript_5706/g.14438 Transcript_5706/m.14438 type:complete len:308 (-) Transcript_5706:762-1685(-)